ncbi:MAG: hypothetical protein ABI688_07365 [Bacteroidota bacterium]
MRKLLIILLCFTGTSLLAQTKEIAFESHSGDKIDFKSTLDNDLFDSDNSDFGLPPPQDIKTYKLDSVIYVSDTVALVITKEYRRSSSEPKDSARFWTMKRDTVFNDPLFTRKHSLDSIKNVLQTSGYYVNPLKKAVFVGYDNNKKSNRSKEYVIPVTGPRDTTDNDNNSSSSNSPFDLQLVWMLGTILFLSLLGGWLSWKFFQPRFQ